MTEAKKFGMSDKQIGRLLGVSENDARSARLQHGIKPWVKQVCLPTLNAQPKFNASLKGQVKCSPLLVFWTML